MSSHRASAAQIREYSHRLRRRSERVQCAFAVGQDAQAENHQSAASRAALFS